MAVLAAPHPTAIEHWFEVALGRKEHEKALEITDRYRRHRFFSTLDFGGRLQSLRWLLEGPNGMLDQEESQIHRQDLLVHYPAYDRLSKQAGELRDRLSRLPLVAEDSDALQAQKGGLAELGRVSREQEA